MVTSEKNYEEVHTSTVPNPPNTHTRDFTPDNIPAPPPVSK